MEKIVTDLCDIDATGCNCVNANVISNLDCNKVTDKIWYKLVNIKYGEIYLSKYISLQKRLKKVFQLLTLTISVSGILSWKFFEEYAWIAFLLISAIQLLLLIENQLIRSDKEIDSIIELKILYSKYLNKLEKLWHDNQVSTLTDKEALDDFFKMQSEDWQKIEEHDSKLDIKKYGKMMSKTEIETNKYINIYYYGKTE